MKKVIKVLIADSSDDFRALLSDAVDGEEDMCVVGSAGDGETAMELAVRCRPDVLVTDLVLRELDGVSMMKELKAGPGLPRTIVVSGFFNDRVATDVSRLGVDYYFPKPCRMPELVRRIRELAVKPEFRRRPAKDVDPVISEVLVNFGIMPHLQGYRYLRDSIRRVILDPNALRGVTKILYPELAKQYSTTPISVERAMRHAIETAWRQGDRCRRLGCLGEAAAAEKRPTNSAFIAMTAEYIRRQYLSGCMEL